MATIVKSENGTRFRALIRQRSFKRQISKTFDTREEAEEWAKQFDRFKKKPASGRKKPAPGQDWLRGEKFPPYEAILGVVQDTPSFPGVYLLFDGCEVVYVGQSKNITKRLLQHTSDKIFDGYAVLKCDAEWLNDVEKHYIREFSPKYNEKHIDEEISKRRRDEREAPLIEQYLKEKGYE